MKTPSQDLADIIIEKIIASGFIEEGDAKKLSGKLAHGKIKEEDWRLAVEKQLERERPE